MAILSHFSTFIPATDGRWKNAGDINLVSLYKIKVMGTYGKDNNNIEVSIDASSHPASSPSQRRSTIRYRKAVRVNSGFNSLQPLFTLTPLFAES